MSRERTCNNCHKSQATDDGVWCQKCVDTVEQFCICCKLNKVDTTKGQTSHCDNCWNYLMGNPMGLEWMDVWMLVCHWHAIHDKTHKDYDAANDCILTAYSEKHGYDKGAICDGKDGIKYMSHKVHWNKDKTHLYCYKCDQEFLRIKFT